MYPSVLTGHGQKNQREVLIVPRHSELFRKPEIHTEKVENIFVLT